MLKTLILKELRVVITGPKFVATFAACSLLLLMSVYIGIVEFKQAVKQHHVAQQMDDEQLRQASSWRGVRTREHRVPDPMQIFSSGLHYDLGRWSPINDEETVKLEHSIYSDDPIFAVFRILDFTMIVQVVFSLFALLFTFDAVNGEKERGTLRLIFANAVPRVKYILAKALGSWMGLVIPLLIPILVSLLMISAFGITLSNDQWLRAASLIGLSLVYVSLFVFLGLLMSAVSQRSSVSFLLSLVVWIVFVLIIPRVGVMAAGQIAPVPQLAEIEGLRDGFAQDQWATYFREAEERHQAQRQAEGDGPMDEDALWARMEYEDSVRGEVQRTIEAHEVRLMEELENRRAVQRSIAMTLSRFSPAATYQLAAMSLAGTDLSLKSRYENALTEYRREFTDYVDRRAAESGGSAGAMMIEIDSEKGMTIKEGRDKAAVDVTDRPRFSPPSFDSHQVLRAVIQDTGILLLFSLAVFSGAMVMFIRFDVR